MADITGDRSETRSWDDREESDSLAEKSVVNTLRPFYLRLIGAGVLVLLLIVCLAIWGSGMEFPTTVSSSEVATSGGGSITLERSIRDVTGSAIDDAVRWVTREGSWLFDGGSPSPCSIKIEKALKWLPGPQLWWDGIVSYVSAACLSDFYTIGIAFSVHGLWENTIDTLPMWVAVCRFLGRRFPLGVLGAKNQLEKHNCPHSDGMQTMPLRLLDVGYPLL